MLSVAFKVKPCLPLPFITLFNREDFYLGDY